MIGRKETNFSGTTVVPTVLSASTSEEKNNCLLSGVYSCIAALFGVQSSSGQAKRKAKPPAKHDRTLKTVTAAKKQAKKAYQQTVREGKPQEEIVSLASNYFTLVRQHSSLKKKSGASKERVSVDATRRQCHSNFWKFTRQLFDDDAPAKTAPQFSATDALLFFTSNYQSVEAAFQRPHWMPVPPPPIVPFDLELIVPEEFNLFLSVARTHLRHPHLIRCPTSSLKVSILDSSSG